MSTLCIVKVKFSVYSEFPMENELRKTPRFVEIGRVDAPDISPFSGVLVDISESGCKVRFPITLEVDMDCEYELKIMCARKEFSAPFSLIANATWVKNSENSCEVGFKIIRSPSTHNFEKFIKVLAEEKAMDDAENELLKGFC